MPRNNRESGRGPPSLQRGTIPKKQTTSSARPSAGEPGRSGYGSESVRPFLRAQLRLKELMGAALEPPNPWMRKPARIKSTRNER